ncbi:MAG: exostosin family protein [Limisphaerales bacterium]
MSYEESFFKALREQPLRQPARVLQALARHLGLQRLREAARLRRAQGAGASILRCDGIMRPARHKYRGYSGPWVEDAFFDYWVRESPRTKLRYLPVFWTDIYWHIQTHRWLPAQEKRYAHELAVALRERVEPTGQYFTVLEYDHAIWDWHAFPRNVIVFSAGGCGDIPLPLLLRSPAFANPAKDIRVSFMGQLDGYSNVTGTRGKMKEVMQGHAYLGQGPGWRDIMGRSVFSLCPRGLGRASFRMYEALSVGSIPVYIWDDVEWLPWRDELDWSEFSLSVNVAELDSLPQRLAAISDEQIRRMQRRIAELYDDYFTLPGVCRQIHKRVEKLADPRQFRDLMAARPYPPGMVPVPIPEGL